MNMLPNCNNLKMFIKMNALIKQITVRILAPHSTILPPGMRNKTPEPQPLFQQQHNLLTGTMAILVDCALVL